MSTQTHREWGHLPNAAHIDALLAHVKLHPARWSAAWDAARDAVSALVAWDDSAEVLQLPADAVKLLASCGDERALLLYPAVLATQEQP